MKRAWLLAGLVLAVAGCDMESPASKKKKAEEEARQKALNQQQAVKPEPPEDPHILVKSASAAPVPGGRLGLIRIARDGQFTCSFIDGPKRVNIGVNATGGGCCTSGDPAEFQMMGGTFQLVRDALCGADSPPCDQPIVVDGDYRAQWFYVRKVLEVMARARMTKVVWATSIGDADRRGVVTMLPEKWNPASDLPATTKKIEVAGKGKDDLSITVDGTVYKDVPSAVGALQKAGVSDIGIHPAGPKTPLWAIVKGVEVAKAVAPAGPVRFVMTDQ